MENNAFYRWINALGANVGSKVDQIIEDGELTRLRELWVGDTRSDNPFAASETVALGDTVEHINFVTVAHGPEGPTVNLNILRYLPETYIGVGMRYSRNGMPQEASLIVAPGFNQHQIHQPRRQVERIIQPDSEPRDTFNNPEVEALVRDRVCLPDHWVQEDELISVTIKILDDDGKWQEQQIMLPARIDIESVVGHKVRPAALLGTFQQ
jgi:hypothetical protein